MAIKKYITAYVNGTLVVITTNNGKSEVHEGGKPVDVKRAQQLLAMVDSGSSDVEVIDCIIEGSTV
jgi:hypothetical protein